MNWHQHEKRLHQRNAADPFFVVIRFPITLAIPMVDLCDQHQRGIPLVNDSGESCGDCGDDHKGNRFLLGCSVTAFVGCSGDYRSRFNRCQRFSKVQRLSKVQRFSKVVGQKARIFCQSTDLLGKWIEGRKFER
jgi:hypothetical protein